MSDAIQLPAFEQQREPLPTTNNATYQPTDEERATIKLVNDLFQKAKSHRKQFDEDWIEYYRFFRGRQWKENRPSYKSSEVVNLIFRAIQSEVPMMTDSRPKMEYLPQEPSDKEFADVINQVCEADWEKNNWLMILCDCLYDAHIYGTAIGSVLVKDLDKGEPKVDFSAQDPFYFFPDPSAQDFDKKCNYTIIAEPTDVDEIKGEYPDKAKYLKPDVLDIAHNSRADLMRKARFLSPADNRMIYEGTSAYDSGFKNLTLKFTVYMKPKELTEEVTKTLDENGNPAMDVDGTFKMKSLWKKKYPNGRKIVMASGVILEDGEIDFEDRDFPYARLINYTDPRNFWGISDCEQLMSPQKVFNKLLCYALDVLHLMGNPIWVVDTASGVDTDNLINRPGLVIEKEPNTEVRREEGVQLQPFVLQLVDRMKLWFDDVSGSNDVSRGAKPEGVTAASAIQELQEAAQTRVRQKSRNLDAFLQRFGQLYLSRILQYYSAPTVVRLTNDQNASKFFKFYVETDEKGGKTAHIRPFIESDDGKLMESLESKAIPLSGALDVRVTTGSTLPFAKAEKFSMAKQLFDAGVIDAQELLKAADYPNWEAVTARMQEQAAQQAMMPQPPA